MKRKFHMAGAPAMLLVFGVALMFGACPSPVDEPPAPPLETVTIFDLTKQIRAPEAGVLPDVVPIDNSQYTGAIVWQNEDGTKHSGNFASNTVYKAVLTLTAKDGYTFADVAAKSFTHDSATSVTNEAGKGTTITVTIIFAKTGGPVTVDELDLTGAIRAPAKGETPDAGPINAPQYTGAIAWQKADGAPHSGNFIMSTVYKAVLTLRAKDGYTFAGVGENSFTHDSATLVINAAGNALTMTVTITFRNSGDPAMVNDLELTDRITAPVKGEDPDTRPINAPQYTGAIAWQKADGTPHSGRFAVSTVYKAELTLRAKDDYTFSGVGANRFTYTGATSVANAAGNGATITVTIIFEKTGDPSAVNDLDLTEWITAPEKGATPDTGPINAPQYTGVIAWQKANGTPHSGRFAADTAYKAELTLTAKDIYTFSGVGANRFTYTDATSVANVAGNGATITVTITFEKTGAPTMVNALDLTAYVTAPAKGRAPDTRPINAPQYTGTIEWQNVNGTPYTGNFAAGRAYKAVLTLTAEDIYTFTGVVADSFAHTRAPTGIKNDRGVGATITVTITFPVTAALADVTNIRAVAGNGQVTFTWIDPQDEVLDRVEISWIPGDENAKFSVDEGEQTYTVENLINGTEYTFTFTAVGDAQGRSAGATAVSTPKYVGAPSGVTDRDLTQLVTAPVKDGTPNYNRIDDVQYSGSIIWRDEAGYEYHDKFAAGAVYGAVLSLKARDGFIFTNNFTHSGATSVSNRRDNETTMEVTIIFPATAAVVQDATVSVFDLTPLVTAPQKDAEPAANLLPDVQYTGAIAWYNNTTNAAHDNTTDFAGNTVYKAALTLTARDGYTFNGVNANSFRYTGATSITNPAGSGKSIVVTITFPITGDIANLTGLVVIPGDKQVKFTWTDSTDPVANHIQINRMPGNVTATVNEGVQTYTVAGLANGTEYTFTFTTIGDSYGKSGAPISVTVTPLPPTSQIKVEFPGPQNETVVLNDSKGTLSWKGKTDLFVNVYQPERFSAFRWELDGEIQAGKSSSSLALNAGTLSVRRHSLTVFVTKNGVEYAKELIFTVTP